MQLTMLKSKIHRATVTGADLHYEGSIGIDRKLIDAANLHLFERVEIYNINNGDRFATYVIEGKDSEISLNGAAARRVQVGDLLIIASYCQVEAGDAKGHQPVVIFVDEQNKLKP
jgi:aspartate 1-decarboxylase